jgi:arginase
VHIGVYPRADIIEENLGNDSLFFPDLLRYSLSHSSIEYEVKKMTSASKKIYLLGSASGIAAARSGCSDGPLVLQKSPYLAALNNEGLELHWQTIVETKSAKKAVEALDDVVKHCETLGKEVSNLVQKKEFFNVFGGDHSCAIGTWSGVHHAIGAKGNIGLIWVDAHMDSHTPETSETGNIHGMPLASILGHGHPALKNLLGDAPKLKPENVCIIGARSFEEGEKKLLERLKVRVYFMDEVKERGLEAILAEALSIATKDTIAYGITIDIDSIDPSQAPGTGYNEPDGLNAVELCQALCQFAGDERLTEKLVAKLLAALTLGKIIQ